MSDEERVTQSTDAGEAGGPLAKDQQPRPEQDEQGTVPSSVDAPGTPAVEEETTTTTTTETTTESTPVDSGQTTGEGSTQSGSRATPAPGDAGTVTGDGSGTSLPPIEQNQGEATSEGTSQTASSEGTAQGTPPSGDRQQF